MSRLQIEVLFRKKNRLLLFRPDTNQTAIFQVGKTIPILDIFPPSSKTLTSAILSAEMRAGGRPLREIFLSFCHSQ